MEGGIDTKEKCTVRCSSRSTIQDRVSASMKTKSGGAVKIIVNRAGLKTDILGQMQNLAEQIADEILVTDAASSINS